MIDNHVEFGEIYLFQFPFTSGTLSKLRPVLILFDSYEDAIVCQITSVLRTGATNILIHDWHKSGLNKPSVARIDRLLTVEKNRLQQRLGILTENDNTVIADSWNSQMRL